MPLVGARRAAESSGTLVRWMGVMDANLSGFVHGGIVMRLCDEVAALAAIRHSRQKVVTAAVDRMTFLHNIQVGELLILTASVNAAWRSSMEVGVLVEGGYPGVADAQRCGLVSRRGCEITRLGFQDLF